MTDSLFGIIQYRDHIHNAHIHYATDEKNLLIRLTISNIYIIIKQTAYNTEM